MIVKEKKSFKLKEKKMPGLPDDVNHLADHIETEEKRKETLKNGLLKFLSYVEKIENEKLRRSR
jgi:hypothetical protein